MSDFSRTSGFPAATQAPGLSQAPDPRLRLRAAATEDEAAEGETEPESADGESPDRDHLAPDGKPLPASERRCFLLGQLLAAALFSQGTAGLEAEVQIVEDLWALFGHSSSV